jgi:hypothetical protein
MWLPRDSTAGSAERLSNISEPVCDLVETRSAQHLISRRELWSWVFAAILGEDLRPEGRSLETEFSHGAIAKPFTLGQLIKHELRGWEQHNHDPSRWSWIETVKFSPVDFDRWLKKTIHDRRFPARSKKRAGASSAKREAVREFLATVMHEGRSNKEIVGLVKKHLDLNVSERTVRRARGLA